MGSLNIIDHSDGVSFLLGPHFPLSLEEIEICNNVHSDGHVASKVSLRQEEGVEVRQFYIHQ